MSTKVLLNNGGTGADLSTTGGSGQYVKQSSAGAALTVGTIAAGDVPTLNQNTTGSAAKLTTARTISAVSFDGSANIDLRPVTAVLASNTSTTSSSMGDVASFTVTTAIASAKYRLRAILSVACSTANGVKIGIDINGTPTFIIGQIFGNTSSATVNRHQLITAVDGTTQGTFLTVAATGIVVIDLYFTSGSGGSSCKISMGSFTNGDTSTLNANSIMELEACQ